MHVWELHATLVGDGWTCRESSGPHEARGLPEGEKACSGHDCAKQFCVTPKQERFEPY